MKILKKVETKQERELLNIESPINTKKKKMNMIDRIVKCFQKSRVLEIKLSTRFTLESLPDRQNVNFVKRMAEHMAIIKTILSLLKLSGFALHVIYLTIEPMKTTLNDLARKLLWEMQKSELVTKALEGMSKNFPASQEVTKVTERTNDAWIFNLRCTLA